MFWVDNWRLTKLNFFYHLFLKPLKVSLLYFKSVLGIERIFFTYQNDCAAVGYQYEIEFGNFFYLMDFDFIASFDLSKRSKLYFINLFFVSSNPPLITKDQKTVLTLLEKWQVLTYPAKNATVKLTNLTKAIHKVDF